MVGVMLVGFNGAVSNTVIIGAISKNSKKTIGSIISTEYFKDMDFIKEEEMIFGGWDVFYENAFNVANYHKIVPYEIYKEYQQNIEKMYPLKGYVNIWDSDEAIQSEYSVKMWELPNFMETVNLIRRDINQFRIKNKVDKVIVVYLALPLKNIRPLEEIDQISLEDLEKVDGNYLPSSVAYAIASILEGCPFIDFTPNLTLQLKFVEELAVKNKVPLAGMDGNTGQTLLKTLIAPMLKIRNLKLIGWYSTNILGNNDGKILSRPEHRHLKMQDKLNVLEPILGYSDFEHVVDISFYKPRYDNKEAWDNIDFEGFLGLPMSFKINWLGRDSILAAPLVLDLIKHMDFSIKIGSYGIQEHLAIYFKHPLRSNYSKNNLPIYKDKLALSFFDAFNLLLSFYQKVSKIRN
ncbi:MAG: inositol-3-phosphate synthase [Candidatus Calescibacterium sp.]|nr:inositol-3-phosphate synthase [Candidatus Calescibacterium sp.]MCX7972491.1 inositol-3-phosphate synthase [bacterium]MDW8195617.1 inositol-3-phosphate synthase [Candidatus Calescibacterium sp.]